MEKCLFDWMAKTLRPIELTEYLISNKYNNTVDINIVDINFKSVQTTFFK